VRLDLPTGEEIRLPLANIHSAKLVLTDRLIAATAPLSSEGADEIEEDLDPGLRRGTNDVEGQE
jgi:ribosome maturation factor RimP